MCAPTSLSKKTGAEVFPHSKPYLGIQSFPKTIHSYVQPDPKQIHR